MIDKVRKGLECCVTTVSLDTVKDCNVRCPYFNEGAFCRNALHKDTKTIIQKLESRLAQAERERDAAVTDVLKNCESCKHSYMNNPDVSICPHDKWQWRGVCPENTKEGENV